MKISLRAFTLWAGWRNADIRDIPYAQQIEPPPIWRIHWNDLAAKLTNAGLKPKMLDYQAVKWYTCPSIPTAVMNAARPLNAGKYDPRTTFAGVWLKEGNCIAIIAGAEKDITIIRHEMTHAMMQGGSHDEMHFQVAFGNFTGLQPEQLS